MTCYNNVMADNSNEDDANEHCETTLNTTTDLVRCKKHTSGITYLFYNLYNH